MAKEEKTTEEKVTLPAPTDHDGSLHRYGLVEVDLGDGTKAQMTVEQAQQELKKHDSIKNALDAAGVSTESEAK